MNEIDDGGEQLSEEEIGQEIAKLMEELSFYNSLHASIMAGEFYWMSLFVKGAKADGSPEEHHVAEQNLAEKERFSSDLREEMEKAGLTREDGLAENDIRMRWPDACSTADVYFLREYKEKIKQLYEGMSAKGYSHSEITA